MIKTLDKLEDMAKAYYFSIFFFFFFFLKVTVNSSKYRSNLDTRQQQSNEKHTQVPACNQ